MLELPHTIIGATIGSKIGNPLLVFPLAFFSNFFLDMLPHWNPHLNTELESLGKISRKTTLIIVLDSFSSLIVGTFLALRFYPNIERIVIVLLSCFFAVLADLIEAPYFFLGVRNRYIERLINFQKKHQWNVSLIPGLLSQVGFVFILLWLLFS